MLDTIGAYLLSFLGQLLLAIFCGVIALICKLVFSLVLMLIQMFFKNGLTATNFINFDQIITMFGNITNMTELGTVIYSISCFIIAFGIIVSGVKMTAGFLDKTGDSPQAFFKRSLYTIILLIGYKTIVSFVIQIMNAIASTGPFNIANNIDVFGTNRIEAFCNLIDSMIDLKTAAVGDLCSLLVTIVLYVVLISKLIPAIITYYERYISFALYLLMGPIVISLGIDPENKDIGKNWLMGILSQMMVILLSMFVLNLFFLQLKAFLYGDGFFNANETIVVNAGLSTTAVANLICCCVLLTLVEKSESYINMLGLRTIPSGDTARSFAGMVGKTIHTGLHVGGSIANAAENTRIGTGRKNGYTGLQRMGTNIGIANANVLDRATLTNKIAYDRLSGIANKTGGVISKEEKRNLENQLVKEGGIARHEARSAINETANKVSREAAAINQSFSNAIKNGTGFSTDALQTKVGENNDKIKLKKGTARELYNSETGSNVIARTADGQEIHAFAAVDDKNNVQIATLKGHWDQNGNFVGKTLTNDDLKQLDGTELAVKGQGNEVDINNPQVPNKFKDDETFKSMLQDARDTQAKAEAGNATREELQDKVGALQQYIDDHNGNKNTDSYGFASDESILDKFKDNEQFQNKLEDFNQAGIELANGSITKQEMDDKAADFRNFIKENGGDEELQSFDEKLSKANEAKEQESLISIGKIDSNKTLLSDSNYSSAYIQMAAQVKEINPEENNGANIATSQLKYDDKTGELHVETNTYEGNVKRDIVLDKNGDPTVRETNQLKEVTSGARADLSDTAFEQDSAVAYTSSQFSKTIDRIDNAPAENKVTGVKWTDRYGVEHDDGTALKSKAVIKEEQKQERISEAEQQEIRIQEIRTSGNKQRNDDNLEYKKQYQQMDDEQVQKYASASPEERKAYELIVKQKQAEAQMAKTASIKEQNERKERELEAKRLAQQEKQNKANQANNQNNE